MFLRRHQESFSRRMSPRFANILMEKYKSKFHDISVLKEQLSLDSTFLRELTEYRNWHPDMRDLSKYVCEKCGTPCDTALSLNRHMHHQHEPYENPETDLVCPHCGEKFKRKYHRDRHASTTCPQRPSNFETDASGRELDREGERPLKKQKRAKRGTKLRTLPADAQPRGSDNGLLSYLQLTEQHVGRLPRVELDLTRLEGLETDIVYKGEIYCRYPGCTHPHRYSEATKLRPHYQINHQFEYRRSSPGHLNPADDREHQNGLRWLAIQLRLGWKLLDKSQSHQGNRK
ncbi:hypothetical protein N7510_006025 [Penicillium lagena]|uniref:uncharacterized protein n=1 Tax=Penicillium lagena TaxID=94218 RepID=UPI002541CA03|nr:uncharacterized protein N7510_006025 [Penicillium lagena]KAJ5612831.1 hypothetical protein N7510_006025 [Penicillium lagena]